MPIQDKQQNENYKIYQHTNNYYQLISPCGTTTVFA
jgi:hypothetical protein